MHTPFNTHKSETGNAVFAFHPNAVEDPNLRNALQTAEFIADAIHAPLMAATMVDSSDPILHLKFQTRLGVSIDTRFLTDRNRGEESDVQSFLDNKELKSAKLIVSVTHLPKLIGATVFNHFGAGLIETSSIPILAVRFDSPPMTKVSRLVFVSDLTPAERPVFTEALWWAKVLGAKVVLTSSSIGPWSVEAQSVDGMTPFTSESDEEIEQQTDDANRVGQRWSREAIQAGVPAEFRLATSFQTVANNTIDVAEENAANMIVIGRAHYRSLASSVLFGGPLHDLINLSHLPILILMNGASNMSQQH